MANLITGYQWGDDKSFIGEYTFENNLDKEEIHMPARTTLQAPPMNLPVDKEAAWDGTGWIVRNVSMSWMIEQVPAEATSGN